MLISWLTSQTDSIAGACRPPQRGEKCPPLRKGALTLDCATHQLLTLPCTSLLTLYTISLKSVLLHCTNHRPGARKMYVTPEQIQAANKATVEALLAVANTQFTALEKLANIQASAVKSAFEDSVANTRALLSAKDVQEFVTLQNSFTQPAIEKAIAYSKSVYEVATEANAELSKVAERRVAEWNENFVTLLDKVSKNAPAGSDVAVAAVKSMLAAANSAYDNLTKVAKQATEIAEANVAAATETVKGLAKPKKVA